MRTSQACIVISVVSSEYYANLLCGVLRRSHEKWLGIIYLVNSFVGKEMKINIAPWRTWKSNKIVRKVCIYWWYFDYFIGKHFRGAFIRESKSNHDNNNKHRSNNNKHRSIGQQSDVISVLVTNYHSFAYYCYTWMSFLNGTYL